MLGLTPLGASIGEKAHLVIVADVPKAGFVGFNLAEQRPSKSGPPCRIVMMTNVPSTLFFAANGQRGGFIGDVEKGFSPFEPLRYGDGHTLLSMNTFEEPVCRKLFLGVVAGKIPKQVSTADPDHHPLAVAWDRFANENGINEQHHGALGDVSNDPAGNIRMGVNGLI